MAGNVNRVNDEINEWQEQEKKLSKIFPGEVVESRQALKGSVEFYKSVIDRYKLSADDAEKRSLTMAKLHVKRLEDKLYPGHFRKLLHALVEIVSPRAKAESIEVANFRNELRLRDQVIIAGFGNISHEFGKHIASNKNEFSISLPWYVPGQDKINYDLKFQKNSKGEYDFIAYTAGIKFGDDPKDYRKQTFNISEEFSPTQAYNLLKGRAVEKEYISLDQKLQTVWKQLDFTDRDQSGNYKMKVIPENSQMNVTREINLIDARELIAAPSLETIINGIKNGNEQYVLLNINGKDQVSYFVADPIHERVNILDEKGEKATLLSLVQGQKSQNVAQEILPEQELVQNKGIKL